MGDGGEATAGKLDHVLGDHGGNGYRVDQLTSMMRQTRCGGRAQRQRDALYADLVTSPQDSRQPADPSVVDGVRDPLAVPEAVLAARRRPMAERLELALTWNSLAAELRAGLAEATGRANPSR
jgi:hypothetical protein